MVHEPPEELYAHRHRDGRVEYVRFVYTKRWADGWWECKAGRHEVIGEMQHHARAKMRDLIQKEGP